jgi:hypothetical protein
MIRYLLPLFLLLPRPAAAERSITELLTAARDPLVRETAAQVLGQRGAATAVPLLAKQLAKDDNKWVRARCAEALGRIGDPGAIRALTSSLAKEKDQRVRRSVARALVRFGQRAGLNELMWQLKAGTNHTKAEVMAFLVGVTGRPLGQDDKAWWSYLSRRGNIFLARRPAGVPAIVELGRPEKTRLHAGTRFSWRAVPAVVLGRRLRGPIPDGCLLLIDGPLTPGAARKLLVRAPGMIGIGLTSSSVESATRELLLARGKLVLTNISEIDRLPASGARLLLVRDSAGEGATVLAVLP